MVKVDLIGYLKNYGFLIPNAEIYGGLAKSWDLGPTGVELKRNLKNWWWKYFITTSPYNVGSDSLITTHSQVLAASGHLKNFHDWLVECRNCHKRHRLDNLITSEQFNLFLAQENKGDYVPEQNCPHCQQKKLTTPQKFNLLLTTNLGLTANQEDIVYLRPETCQGIFTNFLTIQRSTHRSLPFGVGQIGKSFRNEITLQHGIFRTREFEQMELEFFCRGEESDQWWNYWVNQSSNFFTKIIINDRQKTKQVPLTSEQLPHYAHRTLDLYFNYHFGWGEVCSNSHRGNYDLAQHSQYSQQFLGVTENSQKVIPHVIEVSFGVERLMLAILEDAYQEEVMSDSQLTRTVLRFHPLLSPYFVAIIPLSKQLRESAYQLYLDLLKTATFNVTWEETDSIGKSYRRQDAIGTYYCVTIDFQTPQDQTVTCRQRDTRQQTRLNINSLKNYLYDTYEKSQKEFLN